MEKPAWISVMAPKWITFRALGTEERRLTRPVAADPVSAIIVLRAARNYRPVIGLALFEPRGAPKKRRCGQGPILQT